MPLFRRRGDSPARALRDVVPLGHGEQLLAWAQEDQSRGHVVVTTHHLVFVDAAWHLAWRRGWHEVDSATWHPDSDRLTVTWVDGTDPARWVVHESALLKQALRERVQASVVLADEFRTEDRRRIRVVIRQDLATGRMLEQIIAGPGVDLRHGDVRAEAEKRLRVLRSEIGF
ncbi:MAG: hypothetical protein L0H79_14275 [Intrasporangium sp.]|uniref:hypothetical protein n=1 Tax=Intrasporangium sp. TaxID=1925024 RepID=UPI0026494F64|nr:hypothetical protein [Intrasporangium sp.]MDN5796907.1 hypothetical protein [Intrasporangium sp.]